MTEKRNYEIEVLEALAKQPANGVSLQRVLHISVGKMYYILRSLEEAGKIEWHHTSVLDGVWKVK